MDINFELYKIFYHAATLESFSAAAEKLFISQSAVSQSVKGLEKKLGVQLFLRKSRKVALTSEGEMLYRHVEQAYNFLKSGESKMQELLGMEYGEVRIGASDTVCKYYLMPYIKKYASLHPKIKIQLVNRTSSQIIDILKNGSVDFGIITLPAEEKKLVVEDFLTVRDIFVAGERFISLKDKKLPIKTLCSNTLLMLPESSATRRNLDRALMHTGVQAHPEIELESVDLLVEYAKMGFGIAHVLKESAQQAIEAGQLFEVETVEKLPERKLGIVYAENVPLSKSAEGFRKLLLNQPSF